MILINRIFIALLPFFGFAVLTQAAATPSITHGYIVTKPEFRQVQLAAGGTIPFAGGVLAGAADFVMPRSDMESRLTPEQRILYDRARRVTGGAEVIESARVFGQLVETMRGQVTPIDLDELIRGIARSAMEKNINFRSGLRRLRHAEDQLQLHRAYLEETRRQTVACKSGAAGILCNSRTQADLDRDLQEAQAEIRNLEDLLARTRNEFLELLRQETATAQLMSAIAKGHHDTAMAIIGNLR